MKGSARRDLSDGWPKGRTCATPRFKILFGVVRTLPPLFDDFAPSNATSTALPDKDV